MRTYTTVQGDMWDHRAHAFPAGNAPLRGQRCASRGKPVSPWVPPSGLPAGLRPEVRT